MAETTAVRSATSAEADLSLVVTTLMRGPIYRDSQDKVWRHLAALETRVRDYVDVLGLIVVIDDTEGYAYLRSRPEDPDGDDPPPRLVVRRALSFKVSLLLALLRKRLAEFDSSDAGTRLILSRDDIVETLRMFLPAASNEARLVDQIDSLITRIVDLGFLRRLPAPDNHLEVRRILKAFVDAQWLADFDSRLAAYAAVLTDSAEARNQEDPA